jgi:Uma2 family endonuclease
MRAAEKLVMTYAEYLALEQASPVKMQFIDGVAYAMAGGTPELAELAALLIVALSGLVRPGRGRCRVYSADAKIHVLESGNSHYPDVSVVCGPRETAAHDANAITNPTLIVEVLSDSTEQFDRGKKFKDYQRLPSLQHYLLVNQDEARIEHFRRNADDTWTLSNAGPGGAVRLPDLGGDLMVDEIYQAMEFPLTAGATIPR